MDASLKSEDRTLRVRGKPMMYEVVLKHHGREDPKPNTAIEMPALIVDA